MPWWKKLFRKKEKEKKADVLKDIEAVTDFLNNVRKNAKPLIEELNRLEELESEYLVAKEGIIQINLEAQAKILDKLIQQYEFFQSDADINGLRIKMIVKEFLRRATEKGLDDLANEKKKSRLWQLRW